MRILALDIGQTRIGVAVSDPRERVASPVCVLPANDVLANAKAGVACWRIGSRNCCSPAFRTRFRAKKARRRRVSERLPAKSERPPSLPVEFTDERLSSQEAKRSLRESGMSERDMRGKIDMIAASVFLQAWLDARNSSER